MRFLLPVLISGCLLFSSCSTLSGLFGGDESPPQTSEPKVQRPISENKDGAPKRRILVLNFANRSSWGGKELGTHAAEEVKQALSKIPDFIIVPEEEIQGFETFYTAAGTFNYSSIFEKARAHGIVGLVTGIVEDVNIQERGDEIGLFQTRYNTVNASLKYQFYDPGTEKILFAKSSNAEVTEEHTRFFGNRSPDAVDAARGEGAVSKALEKTYPELLNSAKKVAWIGKIARVEMQRFFINAGQSSGISKGQLLKVFSEPYPIVDSESGTTLGVTQGHFRGILKVVDYFGVDGAIAVVHSGAGFRERDRVEVFSPPAQQ
jgi:hypothetical protein